MGAFSRKKHGCASVPPIVAIICSFILGVSYFAAEVYRNHHLCPNIEGTWEVCFTPNQKCQKLLIQNIDQAKKSVKLQGYSFTDTQILKALINAHHKNVDVKIILDNSNFKAANPLLDELIQKNIKVRIDKPKGIAHNKIVVIDDKTVITGSYNFSVAAYKRNTENLLIIHDKNIANEYLQNWQKRWIISQDPS